MNFMAINCRNKRFYCVTKFLLAVTVAIVITLDIDIVTL